VNTTEAPLDRTALVEALRQALEPRDWALALWEMGAAAFGRVDAWSDLDLMCVAEDGREGDVLPLVAETLARLSPIDAQYELPAPTWHGHRQAFYRLRDASPYLLVDICALRRDSRDAERWFLTPERHGTVRVIFDKEGLVRPGSMDAAAWAERLQRRIETHRATFPMFQPLVEKELHRGNDLEALSFYHGSTLRPLVELLRIRYAPHRHDFHTRYAHYDLPPDVVARLRELYFVPDAAAIAERLPAAARWFAETLEAVDQAAAESDD